MSLPRGAQRYEPAVVFVPDDCEICGEALGDEPRAEVVEVATGEHLICHAEPCSYEHGERYAPA